MLSLLSSVFCHLSRYSSPLIMSHASRTSAIGSAEVSSNIYFIHNSPAFSLSTNMFNPHPFFTRIFSNSSTASYSPTSAALR